jgi:hypothetical protein
LSSRSGEARRGTSQLQSGTLSAEEARLAVN